MRARICLGLEPDATNGKARLQPLGERDADIVPSGKSTCVDQVNDSEKLLLNILLMVLHMEDAGKRVGVDPHITKVPAAPGCGAGQDPDLPGVGAAGSTAFSPIAISPVSGSREAGSGNARDEGLISCAPAP
ncbi:hypothetical protein [Massilia violaceinigra]|uniref:hypothetical protein n=1 Tax=Massilia violaceinigra TaxID=2045208 RepID=UPI0012FD57E4|nr:hypothetical protein [Massilia violaceinigra]